MRALNSSPLPQARLLRMLEQAWFVVAGLSALAIATVVAISIGNAAKESGISAQGTLGSLTNPAFSSKIPADSDELKRSLVSDSSLAPPGSDQKPDSPIAAARPPAPSSPNAGVAPAEGTRVLAGSSGAGSSGAKASIESQLGAWLTLDKCQPDVPVFANVRGQWREASILFVRDSLVMVRFADPSFSDEECAVSQLRARKPNATSSNIAQAPVPVGGASAPSSDSTSNLAKIQTPVSSGPTAPSDLARPSPPDYILVSPLNYKPEDLVQILEPDGSWKGAKVKRVEGGVIILYPSDNSDKEVTRTFSQVRMNRELAQARMRERANANRAAAGVAPLPPPGSPGQTSNLLRFRRASDFKPGLLVTTSRVMGQPTASAKVVSVENDMVTAEYLSDGARVTKSYTSFNFERSAFSKPASFYKAGDWVWARMYPDRPDSWYSRRVESVQDGKIVMVWGPSNKDSFQDRAKLPEDVRPLKMAGE